MSVFRNMLTVLPGQLRKILSRSLRRVRAAVSFGRSAVILALIVALTGLVPILGVWRYDYKLGLPTGIVQLTRLNVVVAVIAYAVAVIAVIIAVVAYSQANGRPYLEAEISFSPFGSDILFIVKRVKQYPQWVNREVAPFTGLQVGADLLSRRPRVDLAFPLMLDNAEAQDSSLAVPDNSSIFNPIGTVLLRNRTKYSARNPGIRIEFDGLLFYDAHSGWKPVERWHPEHNGYKAIQWDGGVDNIIHGKWSRNLPDLNFSGVVIINMKPTLIVTVVADGCRPRTVKVEFRIAFSLDDLRSD